MQPATARASTLATVVSSPVPAAADDARRREGAAPNRLQLMSESVEQIRAALLDAALRAYEEAGIQGLCAEGRWEAAVDAMRSLDLEPSTGHPQELPTRPPAKSE